LAITRGRSAVTGSSAAHKPFQQQVGQQESFDAVDRGVTVSLEPPTLFTRTCTWEYASSTSSARRRTCSCSDRSATKRSTTAAGWRERIRSAATRPRCWSQPTMPTRAPSPASPLATATRVARRPGDDGVLADHRGTGARWPTLCVELGVEQGVPPYPPGPSKAWVSNPLTISHRAMRTSKSAPRIKGSWLVWSPRAPTPRRSGARRTRRGPGLRASAAPGGCGTAR
jgi:hypothetical protein